MRAGQKRSQRTLRPVCFSQPMERCAECRKRDKNDACCTCPRATRPPRSMPTIAMTSSSMRGDRCPIDDVLRTNSGIAHEVLPQVGSRAANDEGASSSETRPCLSSYQETAAGDTSVGEWWPQLLHSVFFDSQSPLRTCAGSPATRLQRKHARR